MDSHWHLLGIAVPGKEARRVAAHAAFEAMVTLGINRTWALEIVWRMFAR